MKNLTYEDRKLLEKLLEKGVTGKRTLGRAMGRGHSVIIYELEHNKGDTLPYCAETAQALHEKRQFNKGNKEKIPRNEPLKKFITEHLKDDQWSPEEIAGRLQRFYKETIGYACHETIYKYIYSAAMKNKKLYLHLRRHRPKRGKWYSRKKKINIPDRTSIHDRPAIINERREIGHWEGDSMIFSQQKGILSVHAERCALVVRLHKCSNKTAEETYNAYCKTIDTLPLPWFKSFTYDNGTENVLHIRLKQEFGIKTYFCDGYKSWQKGTVENMNMLIRQYLPRHTKLENLSDEQIYVIQEKLNNRPRKSLNYLTPNEWLSIITNEGALLSPEIRIFSKRTLKPILSMVSGQIKP